MSKKKNIKKLRTQLKKGHQGRRRSGDFTREYNEHGFEDKPTLHQERLNGKGELTRHRTVIGANSSDTHDAIDIQLEIKAEECIQGGS